MAGVVVWGFLLGGAVLIGFVCAKYVKGRVGAVMAGVIPWAALLVYLLTAEYVLPYTGGGASMWPVAQLIGGAIAAGAGVASYYFFKRTV